MRSEDGQVLPMVAAVLVVVALAAVALGRLGVQAAHHARASAAAEASALAGAANVPEGGGGGRASPAVVAAATVVARANGAEMVEIVDDGATVTVAVRVGGAEAKARASRGGAMVDAGLRAALARAGQLLGRPLAVARFRPDGLAFTVVPSDVGELAAAAEGAGLCPTRPATTPGEYEVCDPPPMGTIGSAPQQPVRSSGGTPPVGA